MKRLFFIFAAVMMAASMMAEQKLPHTYCGCTVGKISYLDILGSGSILPKSNGYSYALAYARDECVYVGDFVVEGHHFSILTMSFYKDTLYQMDFLDVEINNDIMELNRSFVKSYRTKYNSFAKGPYGVDRDEEKNVSCSKTDGTIVVQATGSKTILQLSIWDERLKHKSMQTLNKK